MRLCPSVEHMGRVQDEDIPLATPIIDDQASERAGAPQIPTYQKALEELESAEGPAVAAVTSRLQLLHAVLQVTTPCLACPAGESLRSPPPATFSLSLSLQAEIEKVPFCRPCGC
jgi:hypothetical protein